MDTIATIVYLVAVAIIVCGIVIIGYALSILFWVASCALSNNDVSSINSNEGI